MQRRNPSRIPAIWSCIIPLYLFCCVETPQPHRVFDYESGVSNVIVDVDSEGYTAEWVVAMAGPVLSDLVIHIKQGDCPSALGDQNIYVRILGHGAPDGSIFYLQVVQYYTVDEGCFVDCCDCMHEDTDAEVSGRVTWSESDRGLTVLFEDFRIDLVGPPPPPGSAVIHSITLDGEYWAPEYCGR